MSPSRPGTLNRSRTARTEHELLAGTWHRDDLARMQAYSTDALGKHVIYSSFDVVKLSPACVCWASMRESAVALGKARRLRTKGISQ
jgi:hypothetical protein